MRTYVVSALTVAAACLLLVAMVVQQPVLFYMATTFILLLFAGRVQASLALRGLSVRRWCPAEATVGDTVAVRFEVTNRSRLGAPWLLLEERFGSTDWMRDVISPPPFCPPAQGSTEIEYSFVPIRRGRYSPKDICVYAGDSLGISWRERTFEPSKDSLLVLPRPEPVPLDLRAVAGWSSEDSESGLAEGGGIEPRGVREYRSGDSLRHVHWRSSARHRTLLVKQFEPGGLSDMTILCDTHVPPGSRGPDAALEHAIRNAAFVARELLAVGAAVRLTGQGITGPCTEMRRGKRHYRRILEGLGGIEADYTDLTSYVQQVQPNLGPDSAVYLFTADSDGAAACVRRFGGARMIVYLYRHPGDRADRADALRRLGAVVIEVPPTSGEAAT